MTHDDSASLRARAAQCRRLSRGCGTADVAAALDEMAESFTRRAEQAGEGEPLSGNPVQRPRGGT
jgi:hypothetical protein